MLYKVLGNVNIALFVVITSPYWLRLLNTNFLHIQKPWFAKLLAFLRPAHKVLAIVLLVSVAIHGYLALGTFSLHPGVVAGIGLFVTAFIGILYYFIRNPRLLKAHRVMMWISVILIAAHRILPVFM